MKKVVALFIAILLVLGLQAQTPFGIFNSANRVGQFTVNQVSAANLWLGSKLSYNLDQDNPVSDNFLLTAKVLYTPVVDVNGRYAIPIVVTASPSANSVLSAESGYNFGIYPYYRITKDPAAKTVLIAHGGVGYKVVDDPSGESLQQIRALAGLEVAFFQKEGSLPTTISATPVYTHTSGLIKSKTFIEVTGILPIARNLGALVEYQSATGEFENTFRIGIIINTAVK